MEIQIEKTTGKVIVERMKDSKLKGDRDLAKAFESNLDRYGSKSVGVDIAALPLKTLDKLYVIAQDVSDRSVMANIGALRSVRKNPTGQKLSRIDTVEEAIKLWLCENVLDGWIYQKRGDDLFIPWVVTLIKYSPPSGSGGDRQNAFVTMTMRANIATMMKADGGKSKAGSDSHQITITSEEIKCTVSELMEKKGFYHESPDLRAAYDKQIVKFKSVLGAPNEQFWLEPGILLKDQVSWWRTDQAYFDKRHKVINDELMVDRPFVERSDRSYWDRVSKVDTSKKVKTEDDVFEDDEEVASIKIVVPEHGFDTTPVHPYALVFALETHEHFWVHTDRLIKYVYNPELKDKIVLPPEHQDLIDVLAEDMDTILEDIVSGKSGGSFILCEGSPGLGKTLTPEIYSEVVGKPLYNVPAGLLGLNPVEVEKNLNTLFKRAERWNCVLCLDEAELYIRKRGDDLVQNAITGAFLRTMEYFAGLMFMTTNRVNDIDDAIESRCIAIIAFHKPTPVDAGRIWRVQAEAMGVSDRLTDDTIATLVSEYTNPEKGDDGVTRYRLSGRDIRNLLKLVVKITSKRQLPLDFAQFKRLAQFRRL